MELTKLIAAIRLGVELGRKLEFAIRMEVFAYELSPADEARLRAAVAAAQPAIKET